MIPNMAQYLLINNHSAAEPTSEILTFQTVTTFTVPMKVFFKLDLFAKTFQNDYLEFYGF